MAKNIRNQSLYRIGDKVAIVEDLSTKNKVPSDIPLAKGRPRTIVEVVYTERQFNLYYLGSNGRGSCTGEPASEGYRRYGFRSYQLRLWRTRGTIGRPPRVDSPESTKSRTGGITRRHKTKGG